MIPKGFIEVHICNDKEPTLMALSDLRGVRPVYEGETSDSDVWRACRASIRTSAHPDRFGVYVRESYEDVLAAMVEAQG